MQKNVKIVLDYCIEKQYLYNNIEFDGLSVMFNLMYTHFPCCIDKTSIWMEKASIVALLYKFPLNKNISIDELNLDMSIKDIEDIKNSLKILYYDENNSYTDYINNLISKCIDLKCIPLFVKLGYIDYYIQTLKMNKINEDDIELKRYIETREFLIQFKRENNCKNIPHLYEKNKAVKL
jgi:hypothetical protein